VTTIDTDSTTDRTNVLTEVRRVFASGRTRAPRWRVQQLRAIEQMCDEQESAIASALASDLGRSAFEAWMGDVVSTKGEAAFARKHLKKWMRRKRAFVPPAQLPAGPGCSTTRWE
jgi:aldehyde dehydrogenase (NAD+)